MLYINIGQHKKLEYPSRNRTFMRMEQRNSFNFVEEISLNIDMNI